MPAIGSVYRARARHFAAECCSSPPKGSKHAVSAATSKCDSPAARDADWQRVAFVVPAGDARRLNEEELKRLTKEDLVRLARNAELPNRSKMNKAQLARTLRRHFRRPK